MATYLYEATDQKGRIIKGEITALTEEEVMTLLSAKNLIPKVIKLKKEKGRIKNWNDVNVFVVYKCDNEWYEVKSKRTHKYYTIGMAYHS